MPTPVRIAGVTLPEEFWARLAGLASSIDLPGLLDNIGRQNKLRIAYTGGLCQTTDSLGVPKIQQTYPLTQSDRFLLLFARFTALSQAKGFDQGYINDLATEAPLVVANNVYQMPQILPIGDNPVFPASFAAYATTLNPAYEGTTTNLLVAASGVVPLGSIIEGGSLSLGHMSVGVGPLNNFHYVLQVYLFDLPDVHR